MRGWVLLAVLLGLAGCMSYTVADDDDADDDSAAGDDDSADVPGIQVDPADLLDFGVIEECTEHSGQITIVNHGPDVEQVTVDADDLFLVGFAVSDFLPEVTLDVGEEHVMTVHCSPGPGGAGIREASIHVITDSAWYEIAIRAEVVAGGEC